MSLLHLLYAQVVIYTVMSDYNNQLTSDFFVAENILVFTGVRGL